ncbi:MAG: hypothetical protein BMS9Abin05_0796 [Rhodothermia bacterium]|nr:MAG: hypothetical protein BMS9Abin05_0796 [Rhodothermia bacterium]
MKEKKKMKPLLLPIIALLLWPAAASAQWVFDGAFPDNVDRQFSSVHGVAVDPDGKIWVQPFSATDSVQVAELGNTFQAVRVIYVFNEDGSEAAMSPIKFLTIGGVVDTLGGALIGGAWDGKSGRGVTTDADGNIIASQWKTLYKIDYQTGAGMAKVRFPDFCALAEAATDGQGNVFVGSVCPPQPIVMLDTDLNVLGNAVDFVYGFSRDFAVSPNGNRIFWAGYTTSAVIEYARADEFSAFDSLGVVIPGMDSESMDVGPDGYLWVGAGSVNDLPNDYPGFATNWEIQTHYAFDIDNLAINTIPVSLGSIAWDGGGDGRPRGIDFSPNGEFAYVSQFNNPAPSVQRFRFGAVAVEQNDTVIPESYTLSQNYPNPFNPSTQINFTLKESGIADLRVYDVLGREVDVLVNELLQAGSYTASFDAKDLSSGQYLYVLKVGGQRLTGRMVLIK